MPIPEPKKVYLVTDFTPKTHCVSVGIYEDFDKAESVAKAESLKSPERFGVEEWEVNSTTASRVFYYEFGAKCLELVRSNFGWGLAFVNPDSTFANSASKCPWANFEPDEPAIAAPSPESK